MSLNLKNHKKTVHINCIKEETIFLKEILCLFVWMFSDVRKPCHKEVVFPLQSYQNKTIFQQCIWHTTLLKTQVHPAYKLACFEKLLC